jgi:hypothetical protein
MKTKLIFGVLIMLILLGLAGCGSKDKTDGSGPTDSSVSSSEKENESTKGYTLPEISTVDYTIMTSGMYSADYHSKPKDSYSAGDSITAYPLKTADAFSVERMGDTGEFLAKLYSDKYFKEWVAFSGYFFIEENGNITIRETKDANVDPFVLLQQKPSSIGLQDGDNVTAENGWAVENGDFITVVGKYGGYYNDEYGHRISLKYVFLIDG